MPFLIGWLVLQKASINMRHMLTNAWKVKPGMVGLTGQTDPSFNYYVILNLHSIHFYSYLQVKLAHRFLSSPLRLQTIHFSKTRFSGNLFFSQQIKGGGNYEWAAKMTNIKLMRVLVIKFHKSHHLCTLYIFGFCFAVS